MIHGHLKFEYPHRQDCGCKFAAKNWEIETLSRVRNPPHLFHRNLECASQNMQTPTGAVPSQLATLTLYFGMASFSSVPGRLRVSLSPEAPA